MTDNWLGYKILIVEDVKTSLLYFISALRRTGATIIMAQNGEEAIELVKNNPDIDLILMDIVMPKMDGLEATFAIKEINPNIKVILQTAQLVKYNKEMGEKAGGDAYLEKPVRLIDLFTTIIDLLDIN